MSEPRYKWIGTRPIRPDGFDKVTGRASFGADLSLPGMLHGKVLRSPHAHARIRSIDVEPALAIPGVKAVVTSADLPDLASEAVRGAETQTDFQDLSRNVLARDKVLYHGHAVAAVAATSRTIAERALRAIRVDYQALPAVLDLDAALADDAPILHEDLRTKGVDGADAPTNLAARIEIGRGDVEKGFAEADVVVEREFSTRMVHQGYIEPHAVVAQSGEDGHSVVWCCTQGPFVVRAYCARILGLDPSQIRVIPSEIGGGFGGKGTIYQEPLAILLSRRTGRPVKMVMTREEVFRATGPTSGTRIRIKLGATAKGKLTAAAATAIYEAGAFKGSPILPGSMTMFAPYVLEHVRIEGFDVVLNKPKVAAYRAPGSAMAAFAAESALDELAIRLGMDPIDFRLANAAREGTEAPYGPRFDRIGFVETLEAARRHPHYAAPLGPDQGRGIACGFWFNVGLQSSAAVNLNEDGTAVVVSGCPDLSGTRITLAMMAAEELGISIERVRAVVADTETIGYNDLSAGSRVTFATGMAVVEAARDVVRQLSERAAAIWEVDPQQVRWEEGRALPPEGAAGKPEPLDIAELARGAARMGGPIVGRASLTARGAGPGFATHICDVRVDRETGRVSVERYTAFQDVGRAIHPGYVEGQIQGGVAQGIGWALNEEYLWDSSGAMENPGFLDYRMPVASDLPMIDAQLIEVPSPTHPYGVRGVGETPNVPPLAAVANAVHAATGHRFSDLPLSPPRVLEALDAEE